MTGQEIIMGKRSIEESRNERTEDAEPMVRPVAMLSVGVVVFFHADCLAYLKSICPVRISTMLLLTQLKALY